MTVRHTGWTEAKTQKLIELWPTHSATMIADEVKKSVPAVRAKVTSLGLMKKPTGQSGQVRKARVDRPKEPKTLEEALVIIRKYRSKRANYQRRARDRKKQEALGKMINGD